MIVWDLNPVMFSLGPFAVRWYGLFYALGFLLGYYVLVRAAKKKRILNMTKKLAEEYIFLLIIGSIIMARLFYVFVYNPQYYLRHVLEIPAIWQGGQSIHGGLIGAVLVTVYFCRKHKIQFYDIVDTLVAPLALAMVFVRIANYLNGELWGTITDVPWCVQFPGAEGCRHPSQLYEALYGYVLMLILLIMQTTKRLSRGVLFWSFITLYGFMRFIVTFARELDPTDPGFLGLGIGQWLSLGMVVVGIGWFIRKSSEKT